MSTDKKADVKLGIIGFGAMGKGHATKIKDGAITNGLISAVCDTDEKALATAKEILGDTAQYFSTPHDLFESNSVDAVIISTPHYDHPPLAIEAFSYDLNVLIEKPAGVYGKHVVEMNEVAAKSDKVFGIMLNQRFRPEYQKIKELIENEELGKITRVSWIISDWYRTQAYYEQSDWRATWEGEGGGVLINQCPHNLDLFQWFFGLPTKVRAFCKFGQYHDIEVEDDVTAYMEFENGATGMFVTTTGDYPGTNRLEITGDKGKLIFENRKISFSRTTKPVSEFTKTTKVAWSTPEVWQIDIPYSGPNKEHMGVIQNFINAIQNGEKLLGPGEEGIRSLELGNSFLLSEWTNDFVEFPLDRDLYLEKLNEKIEESRAKKK
ncbi:MAG: oxidoreductase [Planctomycetota bacterium]|nr:MAG: oxidoreductase [Planctomycetota bacterium]